MEYDYTSKICIVGDDGIGKQTFLNWLEKTDLSLIKTDLRYKTKMADFYIKNISIRTKNSFKRCKLQLFYIPNSRRFSFLNSMYIIGALGAILFFDLPDRKSFDNLPKWILEIWENSGIYFPILLVGNKSKLEETNIPPNEIDKLVSNYNLNYLEISTLMDQVFSDIIHLVTYLMFGVDIKNKNFSSIEKNFRLAPKNFKSSKKFVQIFEIVEIKDELFMETKQVYVEPLTASKVKDLIDDKKTLIIIDHIERKIWTYYGAKSSKQTQMVRDILAKKFRIQLIGQLRMLFYKNDYRIYDVNEYSNNHEMIQKLLNQQAGPGEAKPITRENFEKFVGSEPTFLLVCKNCRKIVIENIDKKIFVCPHCGFKIDKKSDFLEDKDDEAVKNELLKNEAEINFLKYGYLIDEKTDLKVEKAEKTKKAKKVEEEEQNDLLKALNFHTKRGLKEGILDDTITKELSKLGKKRKKAQIIQNDKGMVFLSNLEKLICIVCGKIIKVKNDEKISVCPYCGAQIKDRDK